MTTTIVLTSIAVVVFIYIYTFIGLRMFFKKDKLTADDYKYMANKQIILNKDCYGMFEIQKAQQEIDLYLERKKNEKK
tara:strand:- start:281 stop:514 length:234 start_codon:yes stop_codon:yes gene_type:complete